MNRTKNLALVGVLGALAFITMLFEIPYPLATWLKFDISDIVTLAGGLIAGPVVGTAIAIIKIVLKFLIKGSSSGGIGEVANIVATLSYVIPAVLLYKGTKSIGKALALGTLVMTVVMVVANYAYITEFYAKMYHMQNILDLINAPDKSVYAKYVVGLYGPFNAFKGIVQSILFIFVHKAIKKNYN